MESKEENPLEATFKIIVNEPQEERVEKPQG